MSSKRERAVWGPAEENVLLELFRQARNDPQARSDRGVKARGWMSIVAELNRRCNRSFDKADQLKSKYARLMQEYELFKAVGGVLGPGSSPLDDNAWEKLIRERPKSAPQLRQFKEHGFPHAEICSRITGDTEDSAQTPPLPPPPADLVVSTGKRSSTRAKEDLPEPKKARGEGKRERASWGIVEEKLLLFLYLKARNDPEVRSDKGIKARGWLNIVTDLNQHCKTSFNRGTLTDVGSLNAAEQCKSKYSRLVQEYDQFKHATGYSGAGSLPQNEKDWDKLIKERPRFAVQLRQFKEKGFPHASACSLIAGKSSLRFRMGRNLSDFLATEGHPFPASSDATSQVRALTNTINAASMSGMSLPPNALPFLLPAAVNMATHLPPTSQAAAISQLDGAEVAAMDPAFFTTELRDNLNMFLKTATTYLVMLINEHNQANQI
ncbi:hypothetical protein BBJ28_00007242 [Nothophytophthora sp. Chile5]|nr:hypothetical protein BBJ28_00007242 [Nothophytophthora sp. Chile5]